jgi:hypothetical protein
MHIDNRPALVAFLVVAGFLVSVAAIAGAPSAVELLFERKHLAALDRGSEVAYRFERVASDHKALGEPFSDTIRLTVTAVAPTGTREVALNVFTGDRARSVQNVPDLTGNPMLVLFLDRTVSNMGQLAGGARAYLKDRIRAGLRDKSLLDAITITYAGKTVDAFRIAVTPFIGDPNAAKMLGYEGAKLTLVLSEAVPGHIVELTSLFESGVSGAPRLEERITLAGSGDKP